jgi:hypothetical protein
MTELMLNIPRTPRFFPRPVHFVTYFVAASVESPATVLEPVLDCQVESPVHLQVACMN